MELIDQPGGRVHVAQAPIWDKTCSSLNSRDHLLIGITPADLAVISRRGMAVYLGQLFGVVSPGLIFTKYLFQGLKRGMMIGETDGVASDKLAATWAQPRDARLVGGRFDIKLEFTPAPPNRVFVVYISRNRMLKEFPHIYGWAEHWTWVASDPVALGAPIDLETRYDKKLWAASA